MDLIETNKSYHLNSNNGEDISNKQIGAINLLRFLAAFFVMMYHYVFMFYSNGSKFINFPFLRNFFHYGYLGVDLFFIISGFVIALSAEGRTAREFLISRVVRLYPALWLSSTLTFLFFMFLGHYHYKGDVNFVLYLKNLTMIPTYLKSSWIDGSYWSLGVELKFYAVIFLTILLGAFKKIGKFATYFSILLFIACYFFALPFNWVSYFVSGVIFYSIYKLGADYKKNISLVFLFLVSNFYAVSRVEGLETGYKFPFSQDTVTLYILSFYIIFYLISTRRLIILNTKILSILGAITYPLYLLHQEVGFMLFGFLKSLNTNPIFSFFAVCMFIFAISFLIVTYLEKKIQLHLKLFLIKFFGYFKFKKT